ncbi:flagellar hook-length control protein FliK [Sphingomonas sp.]|uniref:flagellar hook-length control protein FliK n=1 Tax=Sphingomonas sp. TaxID=28214 RepID=UPI0031E3EB6F
MSSIPISLATDTPPASRALTARNRVPGQRMQFADLLSIKSTAPASQADPRSVKDDDDASDTMDGSGGMTGNAMRQEPAPLPPIDIPIAPDESAEAGSREDIASAIGSTDQRGGQHTVTVATDTIATVPAGLAEASPPFDTALLDRLAQAHGTAATGTDGSASRPALRPVAVSSAPAAPLDTALPSTSAVGTQGPVNVATPGQGAPVDTATRGSASGAKVDTALLDMLARANGMATTDTGDSNSRPSFRPVADPAILGRPLDARLPLTSAIVPPGPLSVTVPGQDARIMSLFAGTLRGLSTTTGGKDEIGDAPNPAPPTGIDPAALGATDGMLPVAAAPGGSDQAPLDMTQQHWPQTMIDRIARMSEDAATADTRIQLSPDALGGVAVAIRQDEGTTHIHFTAEQAGTATLLADAQPVLHRLAEEKGMRLGETAVNGGGAGQSGGEQRPAPQPYPAPGTPARTRANPFSETATASNADAASPSSTRIA